MSTCRQPELLTGHISTPFIFQNEAQFFMKVDKQNETMVYCEEGQIFIMCILLYKLGLHCLSISVIYYWKFIHSNNKLLSDLCCWKVI